MDRRALLAWLLSCYGAVEGAPLAARLADAGAGRLPELLHQVTQRYVQQAAWGPARPAWEGLARHVKAVGLLARRARTPAERAAYLRLYAEAHGHLAYRAHTDLGQPKLAAWHLAEGRRAAREAGEPALLAWLADREANLCIYSGRCEEGDAAAEAALAEYQDEAPPSVRAGLCLHRAEARAVLGDGGAVGWLEAAAAAVAEVELQERYRHLGTTDLRTVVAFEGGCLRYLGRYEQAERAARRALAARLPGDPDRAWVLLDLAWVAAERGEPEQAAAQLAEALALALRVGSAERLRRVGQDARRLRARWPRVPAVRDLADHAQALA